MKGKNITKISQFISLLSQLYHAFISLLSHGVMVFFNNMFFGFVNVIAIDEIK